MAEEEEEEEEEDIPGQLLRFLGAGGFNAEPIPDGPLWNHFFVFILETPIHGRQSSRAEFFAARCLRGVQVNSKMEGDFFFHFETRSIREILREAL